MGLHRFKPMPSGRMGIFSTLSGIKEAAVVEFGCMGHNIYSGADLRRAGIYEGFAATLYTTYIDETDISMGDTYRLEATIKQVIANDQPKVIFLQPSAVPEVIGTDMVAVANELQYSFPETRLLAIGHGSFAISQHRGIQDALLVLAQALPVDVERSQALTYNIIGSCPDLFRYGSDTGELIRLMQ
ncbi:MAG: nitrogen fixation protein NifE, partial [Coriobacteriia bacterium]|nr:nitrogen fixation protein NifE [Coriobacteriia bacterium]